MIPLSSVNARGSSTPNSTELSQGDTIFFYMKMLSVNIPHQQDGAAERAMLLRRDHVTLQPGCTARINE